MMELKEGMYVRTKQGYIAKFKKYDEIFNILRFETPIFLRSWMPCDYMQKDRFMNRYFSKASYNIIDLIEVGDYVNGYKVLEIYTNIAKEKTLSIQTEYKSKDDMSLPYEIPCVTNKNIKSIVTKEQFSSMEYKVN